MLLLMKSFSYPPHASFSRSFSSLPVLVLVSFFHILLVLVLVRNVSDLFMLILVRRLLYIPLASFTDVFCTPGATFSEEFLLRS